MATLRIPLLALAAVAGVLVCSASGAVAQSPLLWLSGGAVLALNGPGRWRGPWALVLVFVAAGGLAAWESARRAGPELPPGAVADDAVADTLGGIVRGPVDDSNGRRRFVVDVAPGRARVLVTAAGSPMPTVLPGDRVRVQGRVLSPRGYRVPGAVDMRSMLASHGAELSLACDASDVIIEQRGAELSAWRPATRGQRALSQVIGARGGDPAGNAVVRAMVAGDRGALDDDVVTAFRDAGVSHVLAVSGLHLAIVALFVFAAVRRAWAAWPGLCMRVDAGRAAALVAAPAAIIYTADAVAAAALLLIAARPSVVWDPSFQLSFAATATLALALTSRRRAHDDAVGWRKWARRAGRALVASLVVSVWAAAATAPFTALTFHSVAIVGPLANLVVVPVTELIVLPFALLGALLTPLSTMLGGALIDVAVFAAARMVDASTLMGAAVPPTHVWPPTTFELVCMGLAWSAAIGAARGLWTVRRAVAICACACAAVIASCLITGPIARAARTELRVTFLDVGQGDAAVVEVPGGETWLIDSGGLPFVPDAAELGPTRAQRVAEGPGEYAVARFLAVRRISNLDVVVISHPHPDHFMGLRAVARAVHIEQVWIARHDSDQGLGPELTAVLEELAANGTRIVTPELGVARTSSGVSLRVLGPQFDGSAAAVDPVMTVNDNSLVVRIERAGRRVLFTGDIELEGEERLVDRFGDELQADVVKAPHHGSPTSSSSGFVAASAPELVVISLGVANRFGFPALEVVERWRGAGARVLRTDESGAVTVVIGAGGELSVTTFD